MSEYPQNQPIRRIVLLKLHEDVDDDTKNRAIKVLTELGTNREGILEWIIAEALDKRKGTIIVQNGLFSSVEAIEAFRASPEHHASGELMGRIADWLVGDYSEDSAQS